MTTEDNTIALPTREELAAALRGYELDDKTTLDRIWELIEEKGWDEACEAYRDKIATLEAALAKYEGLSQSIDYNTEILNILSPGAGGLRAKKRNAEFLDRLPEWRDLLALWGRIVHRLDDLKGEEKLVAALQRETDRIRPEFRDPDAWLLSIGP
jgi:hypothetical protein